MQVAVITDMHFGARNSNPVIERNQVQFLRNQFFPTLESMNVGAVLILGDTWDTRKAINIGTFNTFNEEFFKPLSKLDIPVYSLIGNHDIYFKNTNNINSLSLITNKNFQVIHECEVINLDGVKFGMISWINNENQERINQFISTVDADIICGHFEAIGFETVRGVKAEHGMDHNIFARFKEVWSGHFHLPQQRDNFLYIGNPFDFTWADYKADKAFFVFNTETMCKHYIHNPDRLFNIIEYDDSKDVESYTYEPHQFIRLKANLQEIKDHTKLNAFMAELQECVTSVDLIDTSLYEATEVDNEEDVQETIAEMVDVGEKIQVILSNMDLGSLDRAVFGKMINDLYARAKEEMK